MLIDKKSNTIEKQTKARFKLMKNIKIINNLIDLSFNIFFTS